MYTCRWMDFQRRSCVMMTQIKSKTKNTTNPSCISVCGLDFQEQDLPLRELVHKRTEFTSAVAACDFDRIETQVSITSS
ncbi:unnamed protein product, partial [Amoebophrya sp. A120]|eukprot:GSA120T00019371001.1